MKMPNKKGFSLLLWIIATLLLFKSVTYSSDTVLVRSATAVVSKEDSKDLSPKNPNSNEKSVFTNSKKINPNSATAEELCKLKGIGPKTAEKIIIYRTQNGKFKKKSDLLKVKGIGPKKLEQMSDNIVL